MINNQKAFTLTEVLVSITIMGIITAIAFPSILNLYEQNRSEEFKAYEKVVLNATKVYMDSNSDLLNRNSCLTIKEDELSNYMKSYGSKNGITCTGYTTVKIFNRIPNYTPIVVCKKSGKVIYETKPKVNC